MSTYVCSDIHGNYHAWMKAIDDSGINLENGDNLVILGDLIDRGSNSLECVEYALKLVETHPEQVTYLTGNHERLFLDFVNVNNPKSHEGYIDLLTNGSTWIGNGGTMTISSFLDGYLMGIVLTLVCFLFINY